MAPRLQLAPPGRDVLDQPPHVGERLECHHFGITSVRGFARDQFEWGEFFNDSDFRECLKFDI